jgi:ClpX C4-type zinc finger protein
MKTKPLSQSQLDELRKILGKRKVSVGLRVRPEGSLDLTDEKELVVEAIAAELSESGFRPDGEQNGRSRELMDLLDRISNTAQGCSFCGTRISISDKRKVVAGPNVFICRDCVGLCIELMAEADPEWRDQKIEVLKKLTKKL